MANLEKQNQGEGFLDSQAVYSFKKAIIIGATPELTHHCQQKFFQTVESDKAKDRKSERQDEK